MLRQLSIYVSILLSVLLLGDPAYAISCKELPIAQVYDDAETVLLIRPALRSDDIGIESSHLAKSNQNERVLPIEVKKVWKHKGALPKKIGLVPNLYGEFPVFDVNDHIVFLKRKDEDGNYMVDPCTKQISLPPEYDDLMFLFSRKISDAH